MKTLKTIRVGTRAVVIRSNGMVYLAEGDDFNVDMQAKLAATSSAGCQGLADAFKEAAQFLRDQD